MVSLVCSRLAQHDDGREIRRPIKYCSEEQLLFPRKPGGTELTSYAPVQVRRLLRSPTAQPRGRARNGPPQPERSASSRNAIRPFVCFTVFCQEDSECSLLHGFARSV